jgi:hypothetical protein
MALCMDFLDKRAYRQEKIPIRNAILSYAKFRIEWPGDINRTASIPTVKSFTTRSWKFFMFQSVWRAEQSVAPTNSNHLYSQRLPHTAPDTPTSWEDHLVVCGVISHSFYVKFITHALVRSKASIYKYQFIGKRWQKFSSQTRYESTIFRSSYLQVGEVQRYGQSLLSGTSPIWIIIWIINPRTVHKLWNIASRLPR